MSPKLILFALLVLPVVLVIPAQLNAQPATPKGAEDQIVTLIVKVVQAERDQPAQFSLLKTVVGPGSLKASRSSLPVNREDYTFRLTDWQGKVLETILVTDPMQTRYEYVDERGSLNTISPEVPEKVISIRYPYHPQLSFLEIETRSDARTQTVQSIPISIN